MNDPLVDALQACLEALDRGEDLERVLSSYPELESELRPLLEVSQRAAQLGSDAVPDEIAERSRARLLAQAQDLRATSAPRRMPVWLPRFAVSALIVLAVFLSGAGLYIASAQALPGDALYPVKRAAEGLRINLAPSSQQKLALSLSHSQQRVDEIQSLLQQGRRARVSFVGTLDERGGDRLQIQGVPVLLQATTAVETDLAVGHILRVEGTTLPTGYVLADRIEAGGQVITGTIRQLGPDAIWIDDSTIETVESSEVEPDLSLGDRVIATVRSERGHLVAVRIERLLAPTPTAAATAPAREPTPDDEVQDERQLRFEGTIEQQIQDRWRIAGRWVSITGDTEVKGEPAVGDLVEVRARSAADGMLVAERIERIEDNHGDAVEEVRFEGHVDSIQSDFWLIDGQRVAVDDNTRVEGDPQIGDLVEVRALRRSDGTLYAERIKRED